MNDGLQKIISLIKKTGDRVIVYDKDDISSSYVVIDFDQYLELVEKNSLIKDKIIENKELGASDLTSDDLTDKINRDILNWRNQENAPFLTEESASRNPWAIPEKVKKAAEK